MEKITRDNFDYLGIVRLKDAKGIEEFVTPLGDWSFLSRNAAYYSDKTCKQAVRERERCNELLPCAGRKAFVLAERMLNVSCRIYYAEFQKSLKHSETKEYVASRKCLEEDCKRVIDAVNNLPKIGRSDRAAVGARPARHAPRPHRRRARRPAVRRWPRRLRAAHRRDRRPGRGARHRGRVRALLRPVAPLPALWATGALDTTRPTVRRDGHRHRDAARGRDRSRTAPSLPGMTEMETVGAELWAMGLSVGKHPTEFVAHEAGTSRGRHRRRTARSRRPQRRGGHGGGDPPPAAGDGQGHRVHQPRGRDGAGERHLPRRAYGSASGRWTGPPALRVRGVLEKHQGVINLVAGQITRLPISLAEGLHSHDFH